MLFELACLYWNWAKMNAYFPGEKLTPYVPAIMEQLFAALTSTSVHVQELAISAIGATGTNLRLKCKIDVFQEKN